MRHEQPRLLSLIVCTLGRYEPLVRLLASLRAQDSQNFEVVVVDQNPPGFLDAVLSNDHGFPLRRVRSRKGLSRARNVGLAAAAGDIVGFPDDDCWYDVGVVSDIERRFDSDQHLDLLTGRTVDRDGEESVSAHLKASGPITSADAFHCGNSNALFVRSGLARAVGGFDERLGVGADTPFQSGEETDFILRCLQRNARAAFDRTIVVRHPQNNRAELGELSRARRYAPGFGRVARLHFGLPFIAGRVARAGLRGCACLISGDFGGARVRLTWISGALSGYFARINDEIRRLPAASSEIDDEPRLRH